MTEKFDNEAERTKIITKMAKTDYPISELIARRWSARAFSTKPVEDIYNKTFINFRSGQMGSLLTK